MEEDRLAFVERRDGVAGAVTFARQGVQVYRAAVLHSRRRGYQQPHHASLPEYRRGFIESYIAFKRYTAKNS